MPWSDNNGGGGDGGGWQGGGGGGDRGPWGGGPGGRGPQPPDLDELLKRGQEQVKRYLPGGSWGGRGMILTLLVVASIWAASGFYRVEPDEQGVVLRFGEWRTTTQPGLNYHFPAPVESVLTPKVTRVNRVEVGFRAAGGRGGALRDIPEESLMLTGDENIVDIDFAVFWVIKDAGEYLFNIQRPENTVKAVAESAMREVIGRTPIQSALTEGRQPIELATHELIQNTLDEYAAGIQITQVKMQKVDPPGAVIDSFRDVQAARADLERQRNEAEAYSNDIIPKARGEAEQLIQQAEAYKQEVVARAEGEASRFEAVYKEYAQAKEVTKQRIYLETLERIFGGMNKVIVDNKGGTGVVPYLPLPEVQKRVKEAAQ
jgi:membrane protease subunit HflK